ncbi:hypothetical protein [Paenirhodobacter populi]|uniref:hypothetical protein n=1 Tax=Paenirhodobacter populi TaxID=2306993 RepID=UPI001F4FEB17|nr:hypothetical protein [Sinirhodobacter populi]
MIDDTIFWKFNLKIATNYQSLASHKDRPEFIIAPTLTPPLRTKIEREFHLEAVPSLIVYLAHHRIPFPVLPLRNPYRINRPGAGYPLNLSQPQECFHGCVAFHLPSAFARCREVCPFALVAPGYEVSGVPVLRGSDGFRVIRIIVYLVRILFEQARQLLALCGSCVSVQTFKQLGKVTQVVRVPVAIGQAPNRPNKIHKATAVFVVQLPAPPNDCG